MAKPLEKRINWGRLRQRYVRSSKEKKHKLLDELCNLTGMNRKYLIRKLNQKATKNIASDQLCSKKFKVILPEWLSFYEEMFGDIHEEVHEKLLQISPATIDRLLKPMRVKYKGRGVGGTKPGSLTKY